MKTIDESAMSSHSSAFFSLADDPTPYNNRAKKTPGQKQVKDCTFSNMGASYIWQVIEQSPSHLEHEDTFSFKNEHPFGE